MKLCDVAPTVNNPSSNSESTDRNGSGLNVDGVTQNTNDGDVETDYVVDADNGFEVNEDEPASGDKCKADRSRAQQLKPHQVKLVLD